MNVKINNSDLYCTMSDSAYEKLIRLSTNGKLYKDPKNHVYFISKAISKLRPIAHLILSCPKSRVIDHIDNNPLNNLESNLRVVSRSTNSLGRKNKNTTSKYKGVHFRKDKNRWIAVITVNYKVYFGGYYLSEIDAAKRANDLYKEYGKGSIKLNDV